MNGESLARNIKIVAELNDVLKYKFRKLHTKIVKKMNSASLSSIINMLFEQDIIGANDMKALRKFRDDPPEQCGELLTLLHTSGNREAFVQLHLAMESDKNLKLLVEEINNCTCQDSIMTKTFPLLFLE